MDSSAEPTLFPMLWDSALTGGGAVLIILGVLLIGGLVVLGGFVVFDLRRGRGHGGRSREARESERRRRQRDLIHCIRRYARSRHEAISRGQESPDVAIRSLRDYGEGVVDSVISSTHYVKQIEALRSLIEKEIAVLELSGRRVMHEPAHDAGLAISADVKM